MQPHGIEQACELVANSLRRCKSIQECVPPTYRGCLPWLPGRSAAYKIHALPFKMPFELEEASARVCASHTI
jgi:hypothetical protein